MQSFTFEASFFDNFLCYDSGKTSIFHNFKNQTFFKRRRPQGLLIQRINSIYLFLGLVVSELFIIQNILNLIEIFFIDNKYSFGCKCWIFFFIAFLFHNHDANELIEVNIKCNYWFTLIQNFKANTILILQVFRSHQNNVVCLLQFFLIFIQNLFLFFILINLLDQTFWCKLFINLNIWFYDKLEFFFLFKSLIINGWNQLNWNHVEFIFVFYGSIRLSKHIELILN